MSEVLEFNGTDPFTGEPLRFWMADGVVSMEPIAGSVVAVARGWIVPGLVDAHNHVGIAPGLGVTIEQARGLAQRDLRAGTMLIREVGSPVDTHPLDADAHGPRFVRAGKHIARPKRYLRDYGVELDDPEQLAAEVATQARAGDGWVKLVGDWIDREVGDLAPLWTRDQLDAAVAAAHENGARITAHVFGADALPDIIGAGFDSIEHGTGLDEDLIDEMVRRDIALVPTLIQLETFPDIAAGADRFPKYKANMLALHAGRRDVFAQAREAGVRIYAGTDAGGTIEHGRIVDEIESLVGIGLSPIEALDAASTAPRDWLGVPGIEHGARADFLVLDSDPGQDLTTLRRPLHVVCGGERVV
ncbi:amidohydrolase family protein [Gordonia neofelifaecis]|uniref:Amidohydrolase n=1 Tax=Gordonia neofelifaecis NRRL B-59395 TaxID=644548 RepID=F1YI90_9ACTN|nr:amidohydrolase family protein [Gordonia neofelifaecis]EGD55644.1 amidohydrolase [Gordonia neofelifaecis NRRL B-59395]